MPPENNESVSIKERYSAKGKQRSFEIQRVSRSWLQAAAVVAAV
jgi:hypothetical protein